MKKSFESFLLAASTSCPSSAFIQWICFSNKRNACSVKFHGHNQDFQRTGLSFPKRVILFVLKYQQSTGNKMVTYERSVLILSLVPLWKHFCISFYGYHNIYVAAFWNSFMNFSIFVFSFCLLCSLDSFTL